MLQDNIRYNEKVKPNTALLRELKEKLPQFFTADKYNDMGEIIEVGCFDLEKFQRYLVENNVEELSSGHKLEFIGKDYAKKQAGEFARTVIAPDIQHNQLKGNNNSKNLFFTGDNLEVLRHLQNNYNKSVDMIYIDPPYNTGSDGFIYPDNFEYSDETLQNMFGLNLTELKRLKSIQGKSTHSAWLTFMLPRLWLAKRLLSEKGRIFISIDDNEYANLKLLCDEIFGEISYVGSIGWESKTKSQNTESAFDRLQPKLEHILVYSNMPVNHFNLIVTGNREYPFIDENGPYREYTLETMGADGVRGRNTMIFDIEGVTPPEGMQWKLGKDTIENFKKKESLKIREGKVILKIRPNEEKNEQTEPFWGFFPKSIGTAETAKKELNKLMGVKGLFDTVKSTDLIKRLIFHSTEKNSLVLDFFAGSGTTADAVLQLNAEDGGNRQFIIIQIPEKTYVEDEMNKVKMPTKNGKIAFEAGYHTIDKITMDRVKKASEKIIVDYVNKLPQNFDGGFKHYYVVSPEQQVLNDLESFDLESSLFKNSQGQLVQFSESGFDDMIQPFSSEGLHIDGNATGVDTIVTTWIALDGYKFDVKIENIEFDGYKAYYVDNSRLYLIDSYWGSKQTQELLNAVGTNKLSVQTIVIYGYSFDLESIKEIEIGLKQLDHKVNVLKRY